MRPARQQLATKKTDTMTTTTTTTPTTTITTTNNMTLLINAGKFLHGLSLILNIAVTAAVMLEWSPPPTTTTYYYDTLWKQQGYCNVDFAGTSSVMCCAIVLMTSGLGLGVWATKLSPGDDDSDAVCAAFQEKNNNTKQQQQQPSNKSLTTATKAALQRQLQMVSFANLAHGFGHLVLHFLPGNAVPPIELFVWRADAIAYIVVLAIFWPPVLMQVMPNITSVKTAILLSIVVLAVQVVLDVPPHLSFTYSQSVILFCQSLYQCLLRPKIRAQYDEAMTYLAFALYYLPLFPLMWLETTQCQHLLAQYGGHFVYDAYLAVVPFVLGSYLLMVSLPHPQQQRYQEQQQAKKIV